MPPFVIALCPTYRRPELLANSLALWQRQTYPHRLLVILDDGGTYPSQTGRDWLLISRAARHASLPEKYNALLGLARPMLPDAYLVWEDDDVYLPNYVAAHAACLEHRELSKPSQVLSDYTGEILPEPAAGRFHSTLGFRRELIERIGGWPKTRRADFDQRLIRALEGAARSIGDPFEGRRQKAEGRSDIPYVYGWHTGAPHGQSTMRSPDDETWYERYELPPIYARQLAPKLDARTEKILAALQ